MTTARRALIVFDLDGTLVDSRQDLADSANEMLAVYGAAALPMDEVTAMVGDGAQRLVERALSSAGLDRAVPGALAHFLRIYDHRLLMRTRPYDGIVDALRSAADRATLAVLTNKPEAPSRRLLEAFDVISLFQWVIGGDSAFPRKPDPAALRRLMADAGAGPGETLFVGDSMVDVETARRGGVRMCVCLYGFGEARGPMALSGDEILARTPHDVAPAIDHFVRALASA